MRGLVGVTHHLHEPEHLQQLVGADASHGVDVQKASREQQHPEQLRPTTTLVRLGQNAAACEYQYLQQDS